MKLNNDENLKYANNLIDQNLLNQRENMIWFAKYLLSEYSKEHKLEIDLNFITDKIISSEIANNENDSLKKSFLSENIAGEHKQENSISKKHKINVFIGSSSKKNEKLKNILFTTFHELGHGVINEATRKEFMDSLGIDYQPLYSKKNYEIKKEQCIIKMIGKEKYELLHDFWLMECEAEIIGGTILLKIINDNFSDKEIFDEVKQYAEQLITRSTLILHSSDREELTRTYDKIITHVSDFNRSSFFLRVEYNEDGTRKNLKQLFQERIKINNELKTLAIIYQNTSYGQVIINPKLKEFDELISGFIYKYLEQYSNEEILKQLSACTEEEINFILDSIIIKEIDLKNALEYTRNCDNTPLKKRTEKYILDKKEKCLRLKHLIETSLSQVSSYSNPKK